MSYDYTFWQTFIINCRRVKATLVCLNRQDELRRLIEWADGKGFYGPRKAYATRLSDDERRLFRYRVATPQLTKLAQVLHGLKTLVCLPPQYYARGSAAVYRAQ